VPADDGVAVELCDRADEFGGVQSHVSCKVESVSAGSHDQVRHVGANPWWRTSSGRAEIR
jgi:hypothetical protein